MLSQTGIVAVPTAADTWTTIATETVPAGQKSIKKIRFSQAIDPAATATSIRFAPVFRLRGSGLGEQDPHEFLGNFGGHATTTDGAVSLSKQEFEYDTDIPVRENGTFTVEVNTLDEAITAGTVFYTIVYSMEAPKAGNSMSQYVDAAGTTTADAYATVGTFTTPTAESGKEPKRIKRVVLGVAPDGGTSAITLRVAPRFRLTGSGLAESGAHDFVGSAGTTEQQGGTPVGTVLFDHGTVSYEVDIPIKAGGQILAEHRFEVETPTASTVAVGLVYA